MSSHGTVDSSEDFLGAEFFAQSPDEQEVL